ncbi:hypothetical protein VOA_003291 [Vibrio sp. RC586]|nr:hypothetical protein VOA_003291 [Vibrio sp. RC586]
MIRAPIHGQTFEILLVYLQLFVVARQIYSKYASLMSVVIIEYSH